jgi:UvrD/REP helicase N-terminal domain/UvrD-like helicase C-terminal domain
VPDLALTPSFQKSLARLTRQEQNLVHQTVMQFWMNPDAPGHRLHPLEMRDRRLHSISPNMDLRIIVFRDGDRHVLMYVDHHDAAYRWAERRTVTTHPVTGSAQIVEFEEIVRAEEAEPSRTLQRDSAPPIFAAESGDYLLSLGVPPVYLQTVRGLSSEDDLLAVLDRLPEEAQEALLALAIGERPIARLTASGPVPDPFAHPDAQRRFWIAADEAALEEALARPWEEWLVFLHPAQRGAVERNFNGPARVSGSAGTGKSVVAIHRAAYLARLSTGGRLLLTTFSKTLASRLSDGMDKLLGAASEARRRVEVLHLHGYAISQLDRRGRSATIVEAEDIERRLHRARGDLDPKFADAFLFAEWEAVVDYWGIKSWEAYRDAVRVGRGSPLSPRQRRQLWDVFARVQEGLDRSGHATWGEVCDRLRHIIDDETARPFRHAIVDEAQDLGPRELRLVASLTAPGPRALFFAGDIGQRIYRWPFPWLAAGVDVRGRAQRLRVNYRTSAEIHRFSDTLLPAKLADVDGEEETRQTISVLRGPEPEIVAGQSVDDEIAALARWLRDLRARDIGPGQIAIFGRTRQVVRERAELALAQAGLTGRWLAPDSDLATDAVAIGTMYAAKGLEFRAVALVGCDADHLPLGEALARTQDDGARPLVEERERRLLYVGCTRARESLLITHSGPVSPYLENLTARIVI